MSTDRIEKHVVLRTPRGRVWQALSNAQEFGNWFGVKLDGPFKAGARVRGKVTHKGYEDAPFELTIDRIEPEHQLAWRWHPNAVDPKAEYSQEPMTSVVFQLDDAPVGTRLTVVESGFDSLPASRRAAAYEGNEKGWAMQMEAINKFIAQAA